MKIDMSWWNSLHEKFDALSKREQVLVGIMGWVAVALGLTTFVVEPAFLHYQKQEKQLISYQRDAVSKAQQIDLAHFKLKRDPNAAIDKEFQQLTQRSQALSAELDQIIGGLVSPGKMAELLEQVLVNSSKLKLLSLESLPAERLLEGKKKTGYFVHPVRIVLTGSYFDISEYLAALEQLSVKYYWRTFEYQVEEYPTARLTLTVYTLGSSEGFIGG